MVLTIFAYAALAFLLSVLFTGAVWIFATRNKVVDVPNARSSHANPTPSMGGLGFVLVIIFGLLAAGYSGELSLTASFSLAIGGALIAFVGLLDDWRGVPAKWRLLVQFACAGLVLAGVGEVSALQVGRWSVASPLVLHVLAALFVVWLTNLFNFMDGIDGIASIEAISVVSGIALIVACAGGDGPMVLYSVIVSAVAGFGLWNWPPARIFMGDTGSAFLGFLIGGLAVLGELGEGPSIWVWVVLLSVFIADATFTLCLRLATGQRAHEAHRSHAYQILSRRWRSHRAVTVSVLVVNVFVLFPLAWWAHVSATHGPLIATAVILILAAGAAGVGAGRQN